MPVLSLQERRQRRQRLIGEADRMFARATASRRVLTREEAARDDAIAMELSQLAESPFDSLGQQLVAIAKAGTTHADDSRLIRAETPVNEGVPSQGGFLVQTAFANDLLGMAYEDSVIAAMCTRPDLGAGGGTLSSVKFPGISETSRADGSRYGGAVAYWADEAEQVSASRPRFKALEFTAKKLLATCFVTNEMLADARLLDFFIRRAFAAEFGFKLDLAVLKGTAGQPLGILKAPALITVPKETGQAAATIVAENITNMWKRLPIPSRRRAAWLVNEDVESTLPTLTTLPPGLYQPAGSDGIPTPRLMGAPVIAVEQASVVGTVGDITLADFSHYLLLDGGITPALSAHFAFESDQAVFRFTLQVDGQPDFASPITPYSGSTTRSPFVALATRA